MSDRSLTPETVQKETSLEELQNSYEAVQKQVSLEELDHVAKNTCKIETKIDEEGLEIVRSYQRKEEIAQQEKYQDVIFEELLLHKVDIDKACLESRGDDFVVQPKYPFGDGRKVSWVYYLPSSQTQGSPLEYDPEERNRFVRLIFIVVFMLLMITAAFTVFVYNTKSVRRFFRTHTNFITIPAAVGLLMISYAYACVNCCRRAPCNIILLVLTCILMSFLCAAVTINYKTTIIIYALIATLIVVALLIALACSSFDFTKFYLYFIVIAVALMGLSFMLLISKLAFGWSFKPLSIALLVLFTLLNCVSIVMTLQMILGGRTLELGEDEWCYGSFLLYISIVTLFVQLLQIIDLF